MAVWPLILEEQGHKRAKVKESWAGAVLQSTIHCSTELEYNNISQNVHYEKSKTTVIQK